MRLYLRAVSYFRADWPLICVWVFLIGIGTGLNLLAAWPMAVLVDSVLSAQSHHDLIHRFFLACLLKSRIGQIAGLAVAGLLIKFSQDLLGAMQTIVSNQVNYNGLMRVRCDLYRKLQSLCLNYHRSQPQGDAIYRLSSDTFGCQTILAVMISTAVASVTLVVMSCVLASRSAALTCIAFSIVPFLGMLNVKFGRRLKARSLQCRQRDSEFTTVVQRTLACIGLVQAFGRETEEFHQFRGILSVRRFAGCSCCKHFRCREKKFSMPV